MYPNAFSCVNSAKNVNWKEFQPDLNKNTRECMELAKRLIMNPGSFSGNKDIVYYHDKSISKPKIWDNKYWTAILEKDDKHFSFYKVIPTKVAKINNKNTKG